MTGEASTQIDRALSLLQGARHAVALTGAGVSTPSGIPDFRSPDSGLWQTADPMEVASLHAFRTRPRAFYDWVRPLLTLSLDAEPNPAHIALRDLERHGPLKAVITQNVDLLHSRAGSRAVYEVHGHMRELICLRCGTTREATPQLLAFSRTGQMPQCPPCGAVMKPNIILYGEMLPIHVMRQAEAAARACDLLLIAGSSLETYPVNELPWLARRGGARLIIVNLTPTPLDDVADVVIRDDVTTILPRLAAPFFSEVS